MDLRHRGNTHRQQQELQWLQLMHSGQVLVCGQRGLVHVVRPGKVQERYRCDGLRRCGIGKYNDQIAAGLSRDCLDCASGKFQPNTAAVSPYECANREAGKNLPTAARLECTDCATGKYSAEMSPDYVECPPGMYTGSLGSIDCTGCEVGKYAGTTGKSACDTCKEGKFTAVTHSNSCTACDGGTKSQHNRLSCSACETGKYATPGASEVRQRAKRAVS